VEPLHEADMDQPGAAKGTKASTGGMEAAVLQERTEMLLVSAFSVHECQTDGIPEQHPDLQAGSQGAALSLPGPTGRLS
jgi:hypothetical protein